MLSFLNLYCFFRQVFHVFVNRCCLCFVLLFEDSVVLVLELLERFEFLGFQEKNISKVYYSKVTKMQQTGS